MPLINDVVRTPGVIQFNSTDKKMTEGNKSFIVY